MHANRLTLPRYVAITDTGEYILDGDGLAELILFVVVFLRPDAGAGDVWFTNGSGRLVAVLHKAWLVEVD
jgi:hypothetical protein